MATTKSGVLTPPPECWKHLRWAKSQFWKRERRAQTADTKARTLEAVGDVRTTKGNDHGR